jgi:phospholipid/cholesterol/gamma-HCH transport system substrate-binding protein
MNEFKVGLLALASLVSVAYMSLKVTSNQSGFGEYVTYRTIIKDAAGIFPKTPIRVAGINAGRIKEIELSGNTALVTFEMLEKVQVKKNAKLRIKSVGFLGDKYLDIVLGSDSEILKEGSLINAQEGASLDKIIEDGSELVIEMKKIMKGVRQSVAPEGEKPPIGEILKETNKILTNTREVTETLRKLIAGNEDRLDEIVQNVNELTYALNDEFDLNDPKSTRSKLRSILDNTDLLSSNLKEISDNIKIGKGSLGRFVSDDQIADEVTTTLSGLNRIVNRFDLIRTEVGVFSGYNDLEGADTRAIIKIFPSPERFYLFGLSSSEFGPALSTQTTTTTGGVDTVSTELEREQDVFRFDAQIGRKVQNLSFRGGIIESTGGFGLDYNFGSDRVNLTLEMFDYRKSLGPNIRIRSDFRIWNVFYARVMAEDLINDSRNYSFLAGLKFNDEDLRGLISLML